MPDKRAGVGVTFHTMTFHQNNLIPCRLAEVVPAIGSHRNHPSLKRKVIEADEGGPPASGIGFENVEFILKAKPASSSRMR